MKKEKIHFLSLSLLLPQGEIKLNYITFIREGGKCFPSGEFVEGEDN